MVEEAPDLAHRTCRGFYVVPEGSSTVVQIGIANVRHQESQDYSLCISRSLELLCSYFD